MAFSMLDIKWIRENPETLDKALAKRGAAPLSSELIALDEKRREHVGKVQAAQERRNAALEGNRQGHGRKGHGHG